jgi:hypothetical protein
VLRAGRAIAFSVCYAGTVPRGLPEAVRLLSCSSQVVAFAAIDSIISIATNVLPFAEPDITVP